MTKPLVSVLIDTYNQGHFIEQAIESVLTQGLSSSELEIVVVDDGSTDNTASIVEKFAPRVRYLRKENGGQASAFNAAIPELHGEIIAFLDADDWWAKNKLATVLDVFKKDPSIGMVGHAYYRCYDESHTGNALTEIVGPEKSTRITLSNCDGARQADPLRNCFGTSRLAIRKTTLDKVPSVPEELVFSADAFVLTIAMALADAYVLDEPLCFYRLHAANLYSFRSADISKHRRRYTIIKKLVEVLPGALAAAGVPVEIASALLESDNLEAKQLQLRFDGGWPWETFRTEFLLFRRSYREYSFGYGLYKWLVLVSTLVLSPRVFYSFREWYVDHNLKRFRSLLGEPVPVSKVRPRAISSAADCRASSPQRKVRWGKMVSAMPTLSRSSQFRDAIIISGWNWETFNVPERVALALAHLGARVLYCENPVSRLRGRGRPLEEIESGVYRFGPEFLGHHLNQIPIGFSKLQAATVANQVLVTASKLSLKDPLLIYAWGDFMVSVCREFKRKGFPLIHCCFDYPEPGQERHIALSDLTLTLSKTVFHQLKAKYGEKIVLIPEVRWISNPIPQTPAGTVAPDEFAEISRPRLGYIGPVTDRLNLKVLEKILRARPDWQFIHFGAAKCLPLPNVHVIAWRDPGKLKDVTANLDVGFMPYDCYSNKNFHCMPLKVFDYFHTGLPVVSTPIVNLWEYSDTIYFGDDAEELCRAIQSALDEPADSPKRSSRIAIAREHSIENLAECLRRVLSSRGSHVRQTEC